MNRAHARRRLTRWNRYLNRYPGHRAGRSDIRWWIRALRHRPSR